MTLSKEELDRYLENEALGCPRCGRDDAVGKTITRFRGGVVHRFVRCDDCRKAWLEVYHLGAIHDEEDFR